MQYPDGTRIRGKRDEYRMINGKSVKIMRHVFDIETDMRREYRIRIIDMSKLKVKGGLNTETLNYDILKTIITKIDRYYNSVADLLRDYDQDFLYRMVSEDCLCFEIIDGNFALAEEIIKDFFNCFE
jgi:hypothetical protein